MVIKNILFLCNYFPPEHEAGDGIFARDFICAFAQRNLTASVASRIPRSRSYIEIKRSGINIIFLTKNWRAQTCRYIENFFPDFICAFQVLNLPDILFIKKKYNIPVIYFQQINFNNHLKYNGSNKTIAMYAKLETKITENSDFVFCMSDDDFHETRRINQNTFQIKPGINFKTRLARVKDVSALSLAKPLKIGVSGRLNDRTKGIDLLIKALETMDSKVLESARFSFLGASDCDSLLVSLKKIMPFTQIDVHPWTKDEECYNNWLVSNDLMVVPSRYENVCLTAIEAISCGIPVIGALTGHMKKYIISNLTGWLLPTPADEPVFVSALSERLTRLINSPGIVYSVSQSCRQYAKKQFNINPTVDAFMQMLKKG